MLIPKDKLHDIYDHIKHKVLAAEGSVLICVAGETDAIAACHIFMVSSQPMTFLTQACALCLLAFDLPTCPFSPAFCGPWSSCPSRPSMGFTSGVSCKCSALP